METRIFKPKIKLNLPLIIIGGGLFFTVSYLLINESLKEEYVELPLLVIGSFFGFFGLACFFSLNFLDTIIVYKDRIEIRSILGYRKKTIELDEIIYWTEISKRNKYIKWHDLTIYYKNTKFKISSNLYRDFLNIREVLTLGKKREVEKERQWRKRNTAYYYIICFVFGAICLLGVFKLSKKEYLDNQKVEYRTVNGVVSSKPKTYDIGKSQHSIKIKLKDFPKFEFLISGLAYKVTDVDLLIEKVNEGDSLTLEIEKGVYMKKITKEQSLNFSDKFVDYKFISVYGLYDKRNRYLDTRDFQIEEEYDKWAGELFLSCLSLLFIYLDEIKEINRIAGDTYSALL